MLQILQLMKQQYIEKVAEVRKSSTTILLGLCVLSLPVMFVVRNSNLHLFEPFADSKSWEEKAQNISTHIFEFEIAHNAITSVGGRQNISSKPPGTSKNPIDQNRQNTSELGISQNATTSVGGRQIISSTPPVTRQKPIDQNRQNTSDLETSQNATTSVGGRQNISSTPPVASQKPIDQNRQFFEDELLISGFDRESCLSRHQAPSYRKTKPYKRSSYLTSKLRSYQELHARCGPHSVSYKRTMKKLSRSDHVVKTMPCNYLVWTAANGLGNRMVSIASAFLFALLKNRVLLVEYDTEMDGLFCEPFPNSTWLLPHNFPHKERHWNDLPSFKSRVNTGDGHGFWPPFLHLDLSHGNGDPNLHHFHCNKTQSVLEKIPTIILRSDQYIVPLLFMNPSIKEELNRMFPEKEAIFHHLGRYLFNPSNEAWGLITRFYRAYLSKADEKIGIQIRYLGDHPQQVPHESIMSQILSCTLNHNILPSLVDTYNSSNVLPTNETSKSKAVLIASLYPEFAEKLRTMYWTRPTTNGDVIGVYQPSHEEYQKFDDNMHNMKAWAEIYLLSLCDVVLTSPLSTFGYVAQGLGGLKPWIMSRLGHEEIQNLSCEQGSSMEPCFHVRPKYDCKGKTKIDNFTALSSNLMRCEDVPWGIKLVDP